MTSTPEGREWVGSIYAPPYVEPRLRWTLRDKRRDWAMLTRYPGDNIWITTLLPGNGKHEYLGTFRDVDQAKAEVERRLEQ